MRPRHPRRCQLGCRRHRIDPPSTHPVPPASIRWPTLTVPETRTLAAARGGSRPFRVRISPTRTARAPPTPTPKMRESQRGTHAGDHCTGKKPRRLAGRPPPPLPPGPGWPPTRPPLYPRLPARPPAPPARQKGGPLALSIQSVGSSSNGGPLGSPRKGGPGRCCPDCGCSGGIRAGRGREGGQGGWSPGSFSLREEEG